MQSKKLWNPFRIPFELTTTTVPWAPSRLFWWLRTGKDVVRRRYLLYQPFLLQYVVCRARYRRRASCWKHERDLKCDPSPTTELIT